MKKYTSKILKSVLYLLVAVLVGVTAVYASTTTSLTPSGSASNTMYSLTDIYNLATGTVVSENTGAIETTPSEVALSGKSLSDVYTALSTEIAKLSPNVIKVGTTAFGKVGEVSAGAPAPTFASADVSSYQCSWFTDMTDPSDVRGTPITPQGICVSNSGCSWVGNACTGGLQTGKTYITWYAAKKACANSTDGSLPLGTWSLPTNSELLTYYMDNNDAGNPLPMIGEVTAFQSGNYWSSSTFQHPVGSNVAYYVGMNDGSVSYDNKDSENDLARCAH